VPFYKALSEPFYRALSGPFYRARSGPFYKALSTRHFQQGTFIAALINSTRSTIFFVLAINRKCSIIFSV
jgi:hypothetical protein